MAHHPRNDRLLVVTGAVIWLALGCQSPQSPTDAARLSPVAPGAKSEAGQEATGRIVDFPQRITDFAPVERIVPVDAADVSLRQVLEDLGEDATLWYQHVQTLANPFFEGRVPGSRGGELTTEYIEFFLRLYGLEPAFPADGQMTEETAKTQRVSYRQPFTFALRGSDTEVIAAKLLFDGEPLADGTDFVVFGNSASGEISAPISFVGYGIANGPDGYSSFEAEADLSGRVALLLRYAPLDEEGEPLWNQRQYRRQARIARKMRAVARLGAAAILMVNPPGVAMGGEVLESIQQSRGFGRALDIPVFQITPDVADRLLVEADPQGRGLETWRHLADTGAVKTVDLRDTITVRAQTEVRRRPRRVAGANVGGILPGHGELAQEWVVIGAHHDHVGHGALGGVSPGNHGQLHPGADDNASGTAGVLVLAKKLSEAYADAPDNADLRSVLLLTFDAEEAGLHGSRYFAKHPSIDPATISLVINMDMIGRLRSHTVSVLGTATAEGLPEVLEPLFQHSGLTVSVNGGGSGRSDDASFHRIGVPALHFFTGMHREYTTPADQAYTVNPAGAEEILDLVFDIAQDVARRPEQLVFEKPPAQRGRNRGYAPVRLGIRPGMAEDDLLGVLVDEVFTDTAAYKAGIQDGDVITAWGNEMIESLGDLFSMLQEHKPGDTVTLTVLRDGMPVAVQVTFKEEGE